VATSSARTTATRAAPRVAQPGACSGHERAPLPNDIARPLPPALAHDLGQRFGADFRGVQLHQGTAAQAHAEALDARAYTVGEHVVLGRNAPSLSSQEGRRTLAHELAHVVQQRRGGRPPALAADAPHEHAADRAASAAASGQGAVSVGGATGVGVARDPDKEALRKRAQMIKRNQAQSKIPGVDKQVDQAVEKGIVEEPVKQPDPASPRTRKVPTTAEAKKARADFNPARGAHAKALGVAQGGQVHHGVELQALKRYPGAFTSSELNARENMRGIRPELEGKRQLHNRKIREAWDHHYNKLDALIKHNGLKKGTPQYRAFARRYLLEARAEMDHLYGQFYSEAHKAEAAKTKAAGKKPPAKQAAAQARKTPPAAKAPATAPKAQATSPKAPAAPRPPAAKAPSGAAKAPAAKPPPAKLPASPKAPLATKPSAAVPKGAGVKGVAGGVFSIGAQVVAGEIHARAVEKRIEEKAETSGYVPYDAPSGNGLLYDIGAWLMDPFNDADRSVGMDQRFRVAPWRQHIRQVAATKQAGETMDFNWQVGRCDRDVMGRQQYDNVNVTYRKGEDGRWTRVSGNVPGAPDFNDILSTDVPDAAIQAMLGNDSCGA
jgi:hypothetical protein